MKSVFLFTMLLSSFWAIKADPKCCGCSCGSSGCCNPSGSKKCCKPASIENVAQNSCETKCVSDVKDSIKEAYGRVAETGSSCCVVGDSCCAGGCCGGGADLSQYLGYSQQELAAIPDANLGLGCGHPVSLGEIKRGYTVLDLGSGAGIDCLLAARKVGPEGKVIGVDMTPVMIQKAVTNAIKYGFDNVEFRLGDIEELPVKSNSVDIIISNCVINLATDKFKVFQESYRVLKSGGKMFVSDVVLLKELTPEQRQDTKLICACVGGALLKEDYIAKLEKAGFKVEIVGEDKDISMKWFGHNSLPISSLKFIAHKN